MSLAGEPHAKRQISLAHLALIVPWVALVIGAWGPIQDNSFLWHVRAGTLQSQAGSVLTADPFSFTRGGEAWRTQSWLVELVYDGTERVLGLAFVPFMILLVGTLTMAGIGAIAFRHSGSVMSVSTVLILSIILLTSFLVPRPVLFSYLLMVFVVLAWDRQQTRWTVPLLMWIWASVHASFIIGLAYVGLRLLARREWRALPQAIVAGLITLATAHGLGVIDFLLDFGESRDVLRYLTEWRRPELLEPLFLPFLGGIVFLAVGLVRRVLKPLDLVVVIPFVVLGFSSVRAVPPAWIALVPLVSQALVGVELGSKGRLRPRLALVFGFVVFGLPFLLIEEAALAEDKFPIEAASALATDNVFHSDIVGGFLIWAHGPDRLVYIDDRAELYGERLAEYVDIRLDKQDWKVAFQNDGIEEALLANDEPLIVSLRAAGWRSTYVDDYFTVMRP